MSFDRKVTRVAQKTLGKIRDKGQTRKVVGDDGVEREVHVLMSSQAENIAVLREMPIPPAPAGSGDMGERDRVDPVAYRREMNRKKRARRERRSK